MTTPPTPTHRGLSLRFIVFLAWTIVHRFVPIWGSLQGLV